MEHLEMKNTMSKMKNKLLDGINSRLDTVGEKIIELENGTFKMKLKRKKTETKLIEHQ